MSFKDGEMQTISALGAAVITAALVWPILFRTEAADAGKTKFDDMESIEASVAFKKEPKKQPEKKTSQPEIKKEDTVSHDENKKPVEGCKKDSECKEDEVCKDQRCVAKKPVKTVAQVDPKDPFKGVHRQDDDDNPTGKPVTEAGDFNGNEEGWAPTTKGHPFWQKFAQDIHENFSLPEISEANGIPVGCFHITPDGKIVDTKVKEKSGSPDLDQAAEHAIDAVKKLRNDSPTPVPTELLGAINRWICIRFDPKQAS
ncbi:MAG TPA: TonB C-terminal domain-containing protein [Kofleriaceae bacterium]